MDELHQKYAKLQSILKETEKVAVAFSAGTDSTFLLAAAARTLHDHTLAVTVQSPFVPEEEIEEAVRFCDENQIRHLIIPVSVLEDERIAANPPDRCYYCKYTILSKMIHAAHSEGFSVVLDGSNADDCRDYRPGARAVQELGVRSPLLEAGLCKQEIRDLSKELRLSTWDKPAMACLASRFMYGQHITAESLKMVERAEAFLHSIGLKQVRVRVHDRSARIEADTTQMQELLSIEKLRSISSQLHSIGFLYVSLDLDGYTSGSMNRML